MTWFMVQAAVDCILFGGVLLLAWAVQDQGRRG
jgi:hypothetical protein